MASTIGAGGDPDRSARAAQNIRRVETSTIETLPRTIADELKRRGCTVPQAEGPPHGQGLHNAIRGEFARSGQMDWAVLCSRNGRSTIMLFFGSGEACPVELAPSEDRAWLQDIGGGQLAFSRLLAPMGVDALRKYLEREPSSHLPVDHQGIEDIYVEKGSTVYYCARGTWRRIPGAD